jgi:hypothetical protein
MGSPLLSGEALLSMDHNITHFILPHHQLCKFYMTLDAGFQLITLDSVRVP